MKETEPEVVLIVDDDAGMRDTVVEILVTNGIAAEAVGTGKGARARAASAQGAVAAALVDQRLPDGTGIDLCAELKAIDPDLQAILLTGYATLETAIAAVGHLDEFLTKPVPPDQLVRVVRSALARRRLRRENARLVEELSWVNRDLEGSIAARTQDLSGLTAMAEAVGSAAGLEQVLDAVVSTVASAVDARGVAVYLGASRLDTLELAAVTVAGRFPDRLTGDKFPALGPDTVVTPLEVAGETVGLLVLDEPQRGAPVLVSTLATQAALAVQNAQRLAQELETVERLSELARMKSAFLASVSHELRTPLAAVTGFAEVLESRWESLPEADRQHFLRRMVAQGGRLRRLIENLLDSTSLETGTLRVSLEPVTVEPAIRRVAEARPDGARVAVEVPADLPLVTADEGRLEQVLTNLVDNAVKYAAKAADGQADAEVTISARVLDGDRLEVSVRDRGPGIDPEFLPRLFEAFTQGGQGPENRQGGVGIGLHIARGIVEAMQGSIGVDNDPGRGCRFWFRLPLAART